MKKTILKKYAELIVRCGVNVQKGQEVLIFADLDQPEFVKLVVEEAYKAKAKKVVVEWNYQPLAKIHVRYQSVTTMGTVTDYQKARQQHFCDTMPARIHLISEDPDGLKGMNMAKVAKARRMSYPILKPYIDQRDGEQQWCIAAVPGAAWAKKVFPGERTSVAIEKLWDAIFKACHMYDCEDPVAYWQEHLKRLDERCEKLNAMKLKTVRFYASNGTDITFGMIPEARFISCNNKTPDGKITYCIDIPTEECYITPDYRKTEGIVYGVLPWCYNGQIIEDYWLKFEGGKVVDFGAKKNAEFLKHLIETDEGSHYLGEFALVPGESPVRGLGMFWDMLFDENASCHFALGRGFITCLEDAGKYTAASAYEIGVNKSRIHQDFMIAPDDLNVDGVTEDGKTVAIFRNNTWAF